MYYLHCFLERKLFACGRKRKAEEGPGFPTTIGKSNYCSTNQSGKKHLQTRFVKQGGSNGEHADANNWFGTCPRDDSDDDLEDIPVASGMMSPVSIFRSLAGVLLLICGASRYCDSKCASRHLLQPQVVLIPNCS